MVGESDRAQNQQLNGYARATNPLLAQRKNIYSFSQVSACGTETSVALPCMFSSFKRRDFNLHQANYTENVLDLLQRSGVQVLWRDNDGGCKNVCDRVPSQDFSSLEKLDSVLLEGLEKYIKSTTQDKIIVLHKKGNHGPAYYKRYPAEFEHFLPVCKTNELQACSREQIVNTYDNIIRYTDYFLDQVISILERNTNYKTAMLYVSDHGESLGEHGIYMHAMPYILAPQEQTQVPLVFWASNDFVFDKNKLLHIQHTALSHDNLYHTLIGLFELQTDTYEQSLDFLA